MIKLILIGSYLNKNSKFYYFNQILNSSYTVIGSFIGHITEIGHPIIFFSNLGHFLIATNKFLKILQTT